ncbi:uncharacterized protein EV420DRAFT_1481757 [Desarmillaria tabescens]|uniref:Uncharacterized protein n=1 Tax=Armillaria tabescens TaxID=1929756 RepID=A0AA39K5W9_ARMTA|nr:uncharacterized protein EV420DRAFT_1481757 [Desarmillaria tabescens]KAK0454035.1 hypothetical protein EV420DRAFT_1481757 [Desarmillaria tabescens]
MVASVGIPSDLTAGGRAMMFRFLDAYLNSKILYALLYVINKCWPIRRALVVIIILLHALITVNFATTWSFTSSAFVGNGQNFYTVFSKFVEIADLEAIYWETGITAIISTIVTDLCIIWFCWMVWGRRWLVILLPILSLVFAVVSKFLEVYHQYVSRSAGAFVTVYVSLILLTTLWCTTLIIYRITTVAGVRHGTEGRFRAYRYFIEVLVESSTLYSVSLILYLAFASRSNLVGISKVIAPTLLIGRITAGHRARPDDSWQGSVMASASIRSQSQDRSRISFQEDEPTSPMLDVLESQREISLREASPTLRSVCVVADHSRPNSNTDVSPENVTSSPRLGNHSLFHDSYNQTSEVVTRGSTIVDEAAVSSW